MEKLKVHGITYSEPALAYKLITAANIDSISARIIRSTVKDLTLSSMKETMLKVFDKNLISGKNEMLPEGSQELSIKEEPVFFNQSGGKRKFSGGYNSRYRGNNSRSNNKWSNLS